MILSSKVLGAAALLPFAGAHSGYTPVLRPYPYTEEQNEYILPHGQMLPFRLWTNTEYIHIAQIKIEQNELSSVTPNTKQILFSIFFWGAIIVSKPLISNCQFFPN
jgi:hypothetical protein